MLQLYANHTAINQQSDSPLLAPGDLLQLTANVTGYRGVSEIQWRQNGQTVVPNTTETYRGEDTGYTNISSHLCLEIPYSHKKVVITVTVLGQDNTIWSTENLTILVEEVRYTPSTEGYYMLKNLL